MPVQNSARFKALVQDFCTTIVELSGRSADPELIAQDLALRIATNSRTLRVTEATALRQYIDDDWSKDMARQVWRETMSSGAPSAQKSNQPSCPSCSSLDCSPDSARPRFARQPTLVQPGDLTARCKT